jgi:Leucine-rich repeat (LRR) protein
MLTEIQKNAFRKILTEWKAGELAAGNSEKNVNAAEARLLACSESHWDEQLNLSWLDLRSLPHVFGYLPNLKELWANSNHSLTGMDLTGARQLEKLSVYGTAISVLDLTGLTELKGLWARENKGLTSIDLTPAKKLERVDVSNTGITTLDLTGLTELQELWAYSNASLISIHLPSSHRLERLDIYGTGITTLDLTGLPELKRLFAYANEGLTSIDLAPAKKLELLDVSNTGITNLDLTGLSELKSALVDNVRLTGSPSLNEFKVLGVSEFGFTVLD